MKYYLFLFSILVVSQTFSQEVENSNIEKVLNNYLIAIGANKLDSINSIYLKFEAKTSIGDVVDEVTFFKNKVEQAVYISGNLMATVVATKEECYTISNGVKKALPKNLCDDFKVQVGLFPELNLLKDEDLKVEEVEDTDKELYAIKLEGIMNSTTYFYDVTTGLKVKEVTYTRQNDQVIESSSYVFTDYKLYENLKFPSVKTTEDFLNTGIKAEFKLVDVKYNVENTATD